MHVQCSFQDSKGWVRAHLASRARLAIFLGRRYSIFIRWIQLSTLKNFLISFLVGQEYFEGIHYPIKNKKFHLEKSLEKSYFHFFGREEENWSALEWAEDLLFHPAKGISLDQNILEAPSNMFLLFGWKNKSFFIQKASSKYSLRILDLI